MVHVSLNLLRKYSLSCLGETYIAYIKVARYPESCIVWRRSLKFSFAIVSCL